MTDNGWQKAGWTAQGWGKEGIPLRGRGGQTEEGYESQGKSGLDLMERNGGHGQISAKKPMAKVTNWHESSSVQAMVGKEV